MTALLSPALRDSQDWQAIRSQWTEISGQGLNWTAPENLSRHSRMIAGILSYMVELADATELTLDPAIDTYYFMDTVVNKMPAMLEPLGILRARGTGCLVRRS